MVRTSEQIKTADEKQQAVDETGSNLEELVDDDVKQKIKEELDEINSYSSAPTYWPG